MTEITIDNSEVMAAIAEVDASLSELPPELAEGLVRLCDDPERLSSVERLPTLRTGEVRFRLNVPKPLADALVAVRTSEVERLTASVVDNAHDPGE